MKSNTVSFFQMIAFVGAASTLMPWFKNQDGYISGIDTIGLASFLELDSGWFILLFPVSFLISGIVKFIQINRISKQIIKAIEIIPILLLLAFTVRLLVLLQNGKIRYATEIGFFDSFNQGFYIGLICSVLIVFAPTNQYLSQ